MMSVSFPINCSSVKCKSEGVLDNVNIKQFVRGQSMISGGVMAISN